MSNSSTSSSSTRYLLWLLALIVSPVALYVGVIFATAGAPPQHPGIYWTAYFLKQKRALANDAPSPRIMIYGSSSSFFGIKATKIAQATGLPTVNMATHGGNGIAYTFAQTLASSRPGDTAVILIDASTLISAQTYLPAHGARTSYALDLELLKKLPLVSWHDFFSHISFNDISYALQHLGEPYKKRTGGYWTHATGDNGDMKLPLGMDNEKAVAQVAGTADNFLGRIAAAERRLLQRREYAIPALIKGTWGREISRVNFEGAESWIKRLHAKDVRILLSVPPSVFTMSEAFGNDLEALAGKRAEVLDLPPGLSTEMMFDTAFHTNSQGAEVATARLILALCKKMECGDTGQPADVIDDYDKFMALTKGTNLGKVITVKQGTADRKIRWVYAPQVTFSIYAREKCQTRIDVSARAVPETKKLTIFSDGQMLKQVAFNNQEEADFSFIIPPGNKSREIVWKFDGWRDVGNAKQAMVLSGMKKVVECGG